MIDTSELTLTAEDHDKAFTELSFLLEIFAGTVSELMGGATATVGRIAGRHIAEKLPIYLPNPTAELVMEAVAKHYENGYEMTCAHDEEGVNVRFGKCAIREVCKKRGQEVGGDMCKMFHYAIGGVVNQLLDRPVKSTIDSAGETCQTRLDIR